MDLFILFSFILVAMVANNVSAEGESVEDMCAGNFKCLMPSQCGHFDYDLIYECGMNNNGMTKICCFPKKKSVSMTTKRTSTTASTTTSTTTTKKPVITPLDLSSKANLIPKEEVCGINEISDRIANGKNASIGQFPWMALLGYTTKKVTYPQYYCGGTLISDRYILTAAHCTAVRVMKLSVVRLGEINLDSEKDCHTDESGEYCAPKPIDIPVEKLITHEKYNNKTLKNDIALIRLAERVPEFNEFIRPVCLPFEINADDKFINNKIFEISGWGKTFTSSVRVNSRLQFAAVKGWNSKKCMAALPKQVRPTYGTQVCATGANLAEACKGDSGGPLTYTLAKSGDSRIYQIGIVSFKALDTCGTEELPTVFSRVDAYMNWILEHIEP